VKEYIPPGLGFQWLYDKSRHPLAGQGLTTEQCDKLTDIIRHVHLKDTQKSLLSASTYSKYRCEETTSFCIYLCLKQSSRNEATNMKYYIRLNTELKIMIPLSNISPDFKILTDSKQIHHLH
jgi:hypothetical protein